MASVLPKARRTSRIGQVGDDLRGIEQWFIKQGIPQFMSGYSPRERMPVIFYLLLIVVAFDLAIQPWVGLDVWFLLVMPSVLVGLGLIVKIAILDQISYLVDRLLEETTLKDRVWCLISKPSSRIRLTILLGSVCLAGYLIFLLDRDIYWSNFSVDFLVIAGLLWITAKLFRSDAWETDETTLKEQQRRLYLLVVVAVVYFAFEGSLLPPSTNLLDGVMGTIMPMAVPVPQALGALIVTAIIAIHSHSLIPKSNDQDDNTVPQQFNVPQQFSVYFPAVPLLILVLCAETTILPYVGPTWSAAILPLAIMVAVASRQVLSRPSAGRRTQRREPRWPKWPSGLIAYPGVPLFVVLYLVACPVMVGILSASEPRQAINAFGRPAAGWMAFILALTINVLYLGLAGIIAGFGLDRVAVWAIKEASANWGERVSNLGRGLSILMVFTAFLLLTAETWEVMLQVSTTTYLLLIGSIFGLTGAFHLLTSVQELAKKSRFRKWSDVIAAVRTEQAASETDEQAVPETDDTSTDPEIKDLLARDELKDYKPDTNAPRYPLRRVETINGIIIMMTYEILSFIPVMLIAAIGFLALCYVAVSPKVAANWIYGDRATQEQADKLAQLPLLQQPWPRVALLLTAFSILYLVVEVLSDSGKRSAFFESADNAVRRRLAARLAYQELLTQRWMQHHAYLKLVHDQRIRRRFGRDPEADSGSATHSRLTDTG